MFFNLVALEMSGGKLVLKSCRKKGKRHSFKLTGKESKNKQIKMESLVAY